MAINLFEMDPNAEKAKSAERVSQQPEADLTGFRGTVNFTGVPSFGAALVQGEDKMNKELKDREQIISRLVADIQSYRGKIKGYQTLGHLYQESKQECNHYKQKYEELAAKLDTVMKRLLPERETMPDIEANLSDRDTSITFTTAADYLYRNPMVESEDLAERATGGSEFSRRPLTIERPSPAITEELHRRPSSLEQEVQLIVQEGPTENAEKLSNVDPKDEVGKALSDSSSASSPSFVCLGGSGLSSMNQTPTLDSLPQETTITGNRPTVVDESLTDARALNDLLSDPKSSAEMRAMAADLLRIGSRAVKIEKQARVQQVLLNEMQSEKNSLEQQIQMKQQELDNFLEKYYDMAEKFQQLEMERNPSSTLDTSSLQSSEWIRVKNETEAGPSHLIHSTNNLTSTSMTELNLRGQVQQLQTRLMEMDIMNRKLSEGCEHGERVRQQLCMQMKEIEMQLQEHQRNDLRRQQECDEMILSLKKRRDELELAKEEALDGQLEEKRQRMKAEEQFQAFQDRIYQLENRNHQLERQTSLNLLDVVRPPPIDSSAKYAEHSSATSSVGNKKLLNDLAILQQQVTIYKEDFDHERRDRELSQSRLGEVKLQLIRTTADLESSQQQVKLRTNDLHCARKENLQLKEKFTKALDELQVLKGQIRTVPPPTTQHFQRQLSYGQSWTCQRCTFENPGVRHTCEMCGVVAGSTSRYHTVMESEMDLTGRGKLYKTPLYEQSLSNPLEEDRTPRSSSS